MITKSMFINREKELELLKNVVSSDKAELVVMYGRRRVGKTALLRKIKEMYEDEVLYLLADLSDNLLEIFSKQISERFVRFSNWEDFFEYIHESKYKVVVIDEFQYLYKVNKAFPTQLQRWWEKLKEKNKKIILCGSLITTIYKLSVGYGSALYGRKTRDIKISSLKFKDAAKFFLNYSLEDKVKAYAILGGVPRYLEEFSDKLSIEENILHKILTPTSFLYNEPYNLFFEEFKNPAPYFSIILAIAEGNTKFNEIANRSYIQMHKLSKYLTILERVDILHKLIPVTEKKLKTKHTRYYLKDNFFRFWFTYVFPNKALIEIEREKEIIKKIKHEFSSYVGLTFENIAKQLLIDLKPINFTKIGKWWHKDKEIDIIAINEETKELLAVEVKWQDLKLRDVKRIIEELHEKLTYVQWHNDKRKEILGIFAKKVEKKAKEWLISWGYKVWDLGDIKKKGKGKLEK